MCESLLPWNVFIACSKSHNNWITEVSCWCFTQELSLLMIIDLSKHQSSRSASEINSYLQHPRWMSVGRKTHHTTNSLCPWFFPPYRTQGLTKHDLNIRAAFVLLSLTSQGPFPAGTLEGDTLLWRQNKLYTTFCHLASGTKNNAGIFSSFCLWNVLLDVVLSYWV